MTSRPRGPPTRGSRSSRLALNRTLVRRNRHAFEATPFAGRRSSERTSSGGTSRTSTLILSSKAQNRPLSIGEVELVSSRDIPAGLFAGAMTLDDFRDLLNQPTVDALVAQLVRFGYGGTLLPLIEAFQRTHDIFPLTFALEAQVLPERSRPDRPLLPGRRVDRPAVPEERDRPSQRPRPPQGEGRGGPGGGAPHALAGWGRALPERGERPLLGPQRDRAGRAPHAEVPGAPRRERFLPGGARASRATRSLSSASGRGASFAA